MRLALYQPDIPQNAGAAIRLCAALGLGLDLIRPYGFRLDDRALKRVGMDYVALSQIEEFDGFDAFRRSRRTVVLLTTRAATAYTDHRYDEDVTLLLGRESSGVPESVHEACDARVIVPMANGARSLNVVTAAAIVAGEAIRQAGPTSAVDGSA